MELSAVLDKVHKNMLAVSKMIVECEQLRDMVVRPDASRRLRSAFVRTASKAKALQLRAALTLSRPPDFSKVRAFVADETSTGAAGGEDVWPPKKTASASHGSDEATQRRQLQRRWTSLESECRRLELKVLDLWGLLHSIGLGGESSKVAGAGAGAGAGGSGAGAGGSKGSGFRVGTGASAGDAARRRNRVSGDFQRNDRQQLRAATETTDLPVIDADGKQLESEEWLSSAEMATRSRLMEERAREVDGIHDEAIKMKRIMANLSLQVGAQNESVDIVERYATATHASTTRAVEHLEAAKKEQPGCRVM